jgi:rhamnosyltransferase
MVEELNQVPVGLGSMWRSRICAVIVTYNIGRSVHLCFDSIQGQVGHVLIVDNGSDEATRKELRGIATSDEVTLILNEQNQGLAHALNQAVKWATDQEFEWILTLDHDSEATSGMVEKLVRAHATIERNGMKAAGVIGANPFDQNVQQFFQYNKRPEGATLLADEEPISSGSLIPLRVFETVGLFNEDLFIYCVDTEFCMRLKEKGFGAYICTEAVLLHREGAKRRRSFLGMTAIYDHYGKIARYYLTRNTIYMIRKQHLSLSDFLGTLHRNFKDHVKILLFDPQRFLVLWFSLKGLMDGLRGKVGPLIPVDSVAKRLIDDETSRLA